MTTNDDVVIGGDLLHLTARHEQHLDQTDDGNSAAAKPCSGGAASVVDDTSQGRGNSSGQAAGAHTETHDSAEGALIGTSVLEQDQESGVQGHSVEDLEDKGNVDTDAEEARSSPQERHEDVAGRVEAGNSNECVPDTDLPEEDGDNERLDGQTGDTLGKQEGTDIMEGQAETAEEIQVTLGCLGLVDDVDGDERNESHLVVREDEQGNDKHDNGLGVERALVGVVGCNRLGRSAASHGLAGPRHGAESAILRDEGSRLRRRGALNRSPALAGVKRTGLVILALSLGVLIILVTVNQVGVGLLEQDRALNDRNGNDNEGSQIGKKVGELVEETTLGEDMRIEVSGLGQVTSHGGAEESSQCPHEGL